MPLFLLPQSNYYVFLRAEFVQVTVSAKCGEQSIESPVPQWRSSTWWGIYLYCTKVPELNSYTDHPLQQSALSQCLTSYQDGGDQDSSVLYLLVSLLQPSPHQQALSGRSPRSDSLEMHLWRPGRWAWTVIRGLSLLETSMEINCACTQDNMRL